MESNDIKWHQLPASYVELKLIGDAIKLDNGVIEAVNPKYWFWNCLYPQIPKYRDYNSTPVFCLRSHLDSNFFVQTHLNETKTESETMSNINIFMRITNAVLPNRPIIYAGGDYKNGSYTSALTSGGILNWLMRIDV
jgi:hypothetical protein